MPVVCDFTVVEGDYSMRLGDRGEAIVELTFRTAGRHNEGDAILMMMVRGLNSPGSVDVKINNQTIGQIFPQVGGDPGHWSTQIINIGSLHLKNGDNELQLEAAPNPNPSAGNIYDDFEVRDIICFFKQSA